MKIGNYQDLSKISQQTVEGQKSHFIGGIIKNIVIKYKNLSNIIR
jgi:hypothetical protein